MRERERRYCNRRVLLPSPPFLFPLPLLLSSVHENLFIKIADRGLSWDHYPEDYCNVDQKEGREMIALPIRWMAAEVIAERKYSHYSDVVRRGVVMGRGQ